MYDLDVVGEEMSTVGAMQPAYAGGLARRAAAAPFARAVQQYRPQWLGLASEQGVSLPKEELDFLAFDAVALTQGQSSGSLISFPQRPFRGERLIMAAYLNTGGSTTDALFAIGITPAIYVGAVQVGATQGSTPASAFAATAFGVRLSLPSAGQGTRITIPFISGITLGQGDSLTVTATLIGRAVR